MSKNNVDDIISSYMKKGYDFGFSAHDEAPLKQELATKAKTLEEIKAENDEYKYIIKDREQRLKNAEELVAPLLVGLLKTADSPHIHWPNRKGQLEELIKKFFAETRVTE